VRPLSEANIDSLAEALIGSLERRLVADVPIGLFLSSGVDSALADTLSIEAGFSLLFPNVYRWRRTDSTYVFRNDNPDPSELIREVVVSWMTPAPATLSAEELLEWRARLVAEHYSEPQDLIVDDALIGTEPFLGHDAIRLQAQWRNPPERGWPAGGPLITYGLTCANQDRTYIIDSWLYAPGKEKYEYMIQLETILGTFGRLRAGGGPPLQAKASAAVRAS